MAVNRDKYAEKVKKLRAIEEVAERLVANIDRINEDIGISIKALAEAREEDNAWRIEMYQNSIDADSLERDIWESLFNYLDKLA